MCKMCEQKDKYNDLVLLEKDEIKEIYQSLKNKNITIKIIKDLSYLISREQIIKISKNKYIGLEKIIGVEFSENITKIESENYTMIPNPKNLNDLFNIALELVNILNTLYSINIRDFELHPDKLVINDLGFLIVKDIYFISKNNNHFEQIAKIINRFSNNLSIEADKNDPKINMLVTKLLNNEFNNLSELRDYIINNTLLSNNEITSTNSYTKIDLELLNNTKSKCNTLINQIKSDKILNFNVNVSSENNIFNDFNWLYEIEESIPTSNIGSFNSLIIIKESFTGIVIINKDIHIFFYQGYVIGALNTSNNLKDDVVINSINVINNIEVKKITNNLSIIINNIISSGILLDSSNDCLSHDLLKLCEQISQTNFSGYLKIDLNGYKFYIAYDNGINSFIISEIDNTTKTIDKDSFFKILKNYNKEIELEVFILKFKMLKVSFNQILEKTTIKIAYNSHNQGTLNDILKLGNEYIPNKVKESTIQNILFEKNLITSEKLKILNGELSVTQLIENSVSYKFTKWLLTDLFFELNKTDFKNVINNIPLINNISFFNSDNKMKTFFKKMKKYYLLHIKVMVL